MQDSPGQASLLLAKVTVFSPFFIFALDLLSKGSRSAAPIGVFDSASWVNFCSSGLTFLHVCSALSLSSFHSLSLSQ